MITSNTRRANPRLIRKEIEMEIATIIFLVIIVFLVGIILGLIIADRIVFGGKK